MVLFGPKVSFLVGLRAMWEARWLSSSAGPPSPKLSCCARPAVSSPTTWSRTSSTSHHQREPLQKTPCSMASLPPNGRFVRLLLRFIILVSHFGIKQSDFQFSLTLLSGTHKYHKIHKDTQQRDKTQANVSKKKKFQRWLLFIRSVNSGQSAVCAYRLGDIKATFSRNYKVLNQGSWRWSTRVDEKIANPGEVRGVPFDGPKHPLVIGWWGLSDDVTLGAWSQRCDWQCAAGTCPHLPSWIYLRWNKLCFTLRGYTRICLQCLGDKVGHNSNSGGPCISHLGLHWCPTWTHPPLNTIIMTPRL